MKIDRRRFMRYLAILGGGVSLVRRGFARLQGAAPAGAAGPAIQRRRYDVAIVGSGVFGAWTAYHLAKAGKKVVLLDAYGPGNSRSTSGGESRIIRMGYGANEFYTRSSLHSLGQWQQLSARERLPLFYRTGVLWLAAEEDANARSTVATLSKVGVRFERLERAELERRFPQISYQGIGWGILEPDSGSLMARRAVQTVAAAALGLGTEYFEARAMAPRGRGRIDSITTSAGDFRAATFVFACGPWMGKVFPELLGARIFVTRQEVFFFGVAAGDTRFTAPAMPTWICDHEESFGAPDLEGRGFKVAVDTEGPVVDPDTQSRVVTPKVTSDIRAYLARRFPALAQAPIVETRVCQYENTSSGDFLIDRHPDFENVWLVGGGSGHGFKHGPAVGEYVAERVTNGGPVEERFRLANKGKVYKPKVT